MNFQKSNHNQNEKIETLQSQIETALAEYKQAYIYYRLNPDIPEYGDTVRKTHATLTGINKDIFLLKNGLLVTIDDYNNKMAYLKREIEKEKRKYQRNEKSWGQVKGTEASSTTMFSNFQENYKYQFIYNVALLMGVLMLVGLFLYYKQGEKVAAPNI